MNQKSETAKSQTYVKPGVVAKLLGVCSSTIRNWYLSGRIKGRTLPSGHIQVEICDGTVVVNSERSVVSDQNAPSRVREAVAGGAESSPTSSVPTLG